MSIFSKVTDILKSTQSIPFVMPPQVQAGIAIANQLGLDLPLDEVLAFPSQVAAIRDQALKSVQEIEKQTIGQIPEDILTRIDWLL